MQSFGFRSTSLVALLWAAIAPAAGANGHHRDAVETVYVMPSSFSVPVATSYVVSTSRVVPTAYAVPTYYTTAYWMDPVAVAQPLYAETAYVRRGGLFGRRWVVERPVVERPIVATMYTGSVALPTTYYTPTTVYRSTSYAVVDPFVVPSSYLAETECICPTTVASAAPRESEPARSEAVPRSRTLQSQPEDRRTMSSDVEPPSQLNPATRGGAGGAPESATGSQGYNEPAMPSRVKDNSPPPPPAVANPPQAGQVPATSPGANRGAESSAADPGRIGKKTNVEATAPPVAPEQPAIDSSSLPPIAPDSPGRHESYKPSTYTMRPVPTQMRNVLIGTVRSRTDGELQEGVRIGLRRPGIGRAKETMTNALGNFAVRLTDGEWDVDVTMPSGRVYVVSRLRVSDGTIVDELGRRVPSLEITR